jgi:hypothetical protein
MKKLIIKDFDIDIVPLELLRNGMFGFGKHGRITLMHSLEILYI